MQFTHCIITIFILLLRSSIRCVCNSASNLNEAKLQQSSHININNLTSPSEINLQSLNIIDLKSTTKIIDGYPAQPYQFPYQTAIYIFGQSGRVLFCGGSVISDRHVLTAAHCIFETPERILVIMGNEKLNHFNAYEVRRDTRTYTVHPQFDRISLVHDICILELHQSVAFNRAIQPIALPSLSNIYTNYFDRVALLSGFGKTADNAALTNQLMYIYLRIMDNDVCNEYFNDRDAASNNICTSGDDGMGACQGDSGGPLVIDNTLIGLVSFGARYCSLGYPSVYTRVPNYVKWIAAHTGIQIY